MKKIGIFILIMLSIGCTNKNYILENKVMLGIRVKEISNAEFIKSEFNLSLENVLVIIRISPNSLAEHYKLKENDVILSIDNKNITNADDFKSAIKNKSHFIMKIWRNGEFLTFDIIK